MASKTAAKPAAKTVSRTKTAPAAKSAAAKPAPAPKKAAPKAAEAPKKSVAKRAPVKKAEGTNIPTAVISLVPSEIEIPEYKKAGRLDLFNAKTLPPHIAELHKSIVENGLMQPIAVLKVGEGKYRLIAGLCRLMAYKMFPNSVLGKAKIDARVFDIDPNRAYTLTHVENARRSAPTFAELCEVVTHLKESNLTAEQVAAELGEAPSTVRAAISLWKALGDEGKNALSAGQITRDEATNIAKLEPPQQAKVVASLVKSSRKPEIKETRSAKAQKRNEQINKAHAEASGANEGSTLGLKKPPIGYCRDAAAHLFEIARQIGSTYPSDAFRCEAMAETLLLAVGDKDPKSVFTRYVPQTTPDQKVIIPEMVLQGAPAEKSPASAPKTPAAPVESAPAREPVRRASRAVPKRTAART